MADKVNNSRQSKKERSAMIEMARAPRHAAPVVETPKGETTLADLVAENARQIKELTGTVGANSVSLNRHREQLDDHEKRIAALEGRLPRTSSEAEQEAEEEAATKAESEAGKAEAPKPETTDKAKPEADKVKTDLVKPCFDDAPVGCYDIIFVYEHEHANRLTGKIEKRWKKTFSEAMQASNGKYLGKRRAWVDRQGNYLRHLTPEEIERYYPGGEVR